MDEFKKGAAPVGWGRKERKYSKAIARAQLKEQDRELISNYNDPCYYCTGGQHCGSCKCCTYSDTR